MLAIPIPGEQANGYVKRPAASARALAEGHHPRHIRTFVRNIRGVTRPRVKLTAKRQSRIARNSFSRRLSSIRLTPPTRANWGLVAKASQNVFEASVTLVRMNRWTVREEMVKC